MSRVKKKWFPGDAGPPVLMTNDAKHPGARVPRYYGGPAIPFWKEPAAYFVSKPFDITLTPGKWRLAVMRGDGPEDHARREHAVRILRAKVSDMRAFLEDCLSGRTAYEQSMMEYRVSVEFPLYSHLGTLSAVAPDFVDWFCE